MHLSLGMFIALACSGVCLQCMIPLPVCQRPCCANKSCTLSRSAAVPCRDEQLRRELEELVSAASAVQATEANLAVAQTSADALRGAPPIKVRRMAAAVLGQDVSSRTSSGRMSGHQSSLSCSSVRRSHQAAIAVVAPPNCLVTLLANWRRWRWACSCRPSPAKTWCWWAAIPAWAHGAWTMRCP